MSITKVVSQIIQEYSKKVAAAVPACDYAIYLKKFKAGGREVTIFNAPTTAISNKILKSLFPDWTKENHLEAASQYEKHGKEVYNQLKQLRNQAANKLWGRDWEFTDFKTSGAQNDEFPEDVKEELRKLSYIITKCSLLVSANLKVAKEVNKIKNLKTPVEGATKKADFNTKKQNELRDKLDEYYDELEAISDDMAEAKKANDIELYKELQLQFKFIETQIRKINQQIIDLYN
jgi:vacuolar-type H+-ATPase subunit I/STV1